TLDNVLVDGMVISDAKTSSTVQVDSGAALGFEDATIKGGTLDLLGSLNSTGASFITGATIVNSGHLNVVSGSLTIDPTPMTNTGTVEVYDGASLVLSDDVVTN